MTTAIMTRSAARTTGVATNPEYWCDSCGTYHAGPCASGAHRQLGDLLARMVGEADARIPQERRARRTLQEMMPGYDRQPVLVLHRPVMADDSCPLCGRWNCDPTTCPPAAAAPDPETVTASHDGQCRVCGATFPGWNGGVCDACRNTGR